MSTQYLSTLHVTLVALSRQPISTKLVFDLKDCASQFGVTLHSTSGQVSNGAYHQERWLIPQPLETEQRELLRSIANNYQTDLCFLRPEIIPSEIKNKIVLFCNEIQCDFCELDVLFDQDSQKWFVIDVNKTPYGPPASLTALDKEKAVTQLSNGFQRNFLQ